MQHDWLGWPWENKTRSIYDAHTPHRAVHNWEVPQLIIHGDADFRVPVTEGIAAFNALQQWVSHSTVASRSSSAMQLLTTYVRRGVPSRLLIFDHEPHTFSNPHNMCVFCALAVLARD